MNFEMFLIRYFSKDRETYIVPDTCNDIDVESAH